MRFEEILIIENTELSSTYQNINNISSFDKIWQKIGKNVATIRPKFSKLPFFGNFDQPLSTFG